jgi:hypothetical protein
MTNDGGGSATFESAKGAGVVGVNKRMLIEYDVEMGCGFTGGSLETK